MNNRTSMTSSTASMNAWLSPQPALDNMALIDLLFNRLDGLYPNRWRASFRNEQAIANWREAWADGFVAEGLTPKDVREGVKACRTRFDWPPSFAEFVSACRPQLDAEAAHTEAVRQIRLREFGMDTWSHPAIFWAAQSIGRFDLLRLPYDQIRKRWEGALRRETAKGEWVDIPKAAKAQPRLTTQATDTFKRERGWIKSRVSQLKGESHAIPC